MAYDVADLNAATMVAAMLAEFGNADLVEGLAMEIVQAFRNAGWAQPEGGN